MCAPVSRLAGFTRAWLANAAEDNLREIAVSKDGVEVAVPPYAIVTLPAGTGSAPLRPIAFGYNARDSTKCDVSVR